MLSTTANSSHVLSSPFLFPSRLATRLKSKGIPEGGVQSVSDEDMCYSSKELQDFIFIYMQRNQMHMYIYGYCGDSIIAEEM